jgi:phosphatidylglycerophosphatase A
MREAIKIITSFFYLGYAPFASGTVGSLGGLAIYFFVKDNAVLFVLSTLVVFILGMMFSGEAEKIFGKKDPGKIVIDEVAGMLISLLFLPCKIWIVAAAFLLFRFFDIIKPPPARRVEALAGSYGIMLDDVIAGLYTNIILQVLVKIAKI